ncbi:MAG TPA: hypothetical protein DDZ51_28695 [Planctomycetaceae bacterium]|nr:hypothetical protein [Planctomycetaceae bacterium]
MLPPAPKAATNRNCALLSSKAITSPVRLVGLRDDLAGGVKDGRGGELAVLIRDQRVMLGAHLRISRIDLRASA